MRFMTKSKSILRYAGGKSRAVKIITPMLPKDIGRIVSVFGGGCSLEVHWANNLPVDEVIAYDVFDILVNFWNIALKQPDTLADALAEYKATKECYYENKEVLKQHFLGNAAINDSVKLAASYYYNHQLSYGPMFLGWSSSVYLTEKNYAKIISNVRNFRCPKLKVKQGSFEQTIPKHKKDFLYLDPPYYTGTNTNMFKAIYPNPNFPIHHKAFDHNMLCNLLHQHNNDFILSYNDCDDIRKMYKAYHHSFPKWHYSYQQGESRIGKNRINAGRSNVKKDSHEILIYTR
jgi:DNA adenine methylase